MTCGSRSAGAPARATGQATLVLVQVAEVLDKRAQLANESFVC